MAKATITKNEYLQLEGLAALSKRHIATVTECQAAMSEIIGVRPEEFAVDDVAYGGRDIAWLLEQQKITVVD